MPRLLVPFLGLALALGSASLIPSPATAASLDVRGWLERPGVKLLAVEFYATWCKPCMEAVPRWRELHERYRKDGLRLVVVATQDPEAGCVNPGWNPDEVICDDEGVLARMMGADDRLPAAFLWSWQGNLLVRKGHVDEVEDAAESWIRDAPRVDVQVGRIAKGAGVTELELRDLVRAELGRSAKLTMVASEEERRRLTELKRKAFEQRFDEKSRCELGKELSPNSLLEVNVIGRPERRRLRLGLLSVERGCLMGSALVDWNRSIPTVSVAEAGVELFQKLRPEIQMPRGRSMSFVSPAGRRAPLEEDIGETAEPWDPGVATDRVIVSFASDPPGAVVLLDGELLCQDTSRGCSRAIPRGVHTVTMQRERYEKRTESVEVDAGLRLEWKLEPSFGVFEVRSDPPGLELRVDGRAIGKTPAVGVELDPGRRELLLSDPCYYDKGKRLRVRKGDQRTLDFEMQPRIGALDVVLVDRAGNAERGEVWVDGNRVGRAPGVLKLPVCTETLEIRQGSRIVWQGPVEMEARTLTHLRAVVGATSSGRGERGPVLVYQSPEHVDLESDGANAEGRTILAAVRSASPEPTIVRSLVGFAGPGTAGGVLVIPELEKAVPRPGRAGEAAFERFVSEGGRVIATLDDPRERRLLRMLERVFRWSSIRTKSSGKGSRSERTEVAARLGLGPRDLPHNNDTDALLKSSLPGEALALYADEAGDPVVSLIPHGSGFVAILGWDWFKGAPLGSVDGGWTEVLGRLLVLRLEPPPASAGPEPSAAPAGGALVYTNSNAVDYRPGDEQSEGVALYAAVSGTGVEAEALVELRGGRLGAALADKAVFIIPDLEKGPPIYDRRAVVDLRGFVREGGRLVVTLDESGKDRAAALLSEVFGFRLRIKADPKGQRFRRSSTADGLGAAVPAVLPSNNDTDAIERGTLPRDAVVLYEDEDGDAVVARMPYGDGSVVVLGWDWYDGAPVGKQDGGWIRLLDRIVTEVAGTGGASAVTATRGSVAFVSDPRFIDMRSDRPGGRLMRGLRGLGFDLDTYYLGAFGDAHRKLDEVKVGLLPTLTESDPRDLARQSRTAAKGVRAFVSRGGRLVVLWGPDEATRARTTAFLEPALRFRDPGGGVPRGEGRLDASVAAELGLGGLPSALEATPGQTVSFDARRLPRGTSVLYADDAGRALVARVPYRHGELYVVGSDGSGVDAAGGWRRLLDVLLR